MVGKSVGVSINKDIIQGGMYNNIGSYRCWLITLSSVIGHHRVAVYLPGAQSLISSFSL